jgi:protein-S-isoprenylcysteine O-methyltransferase Ste14
MRLLLHTAAFTLIAPGSLAVGVPALVVWRTGAQPGERPVLAVASALMAVGVAVFLWCTFDFIKFGRGTPDPGRPPIVLVVWGLFRISRNPMYISVVTLILGEALLFVSALLVVWAMVVLLAFHLRVVRYEEPALARTFGAAWDDYRLRVPRWLPRLRAGMRVG